jgi:thiol-disulfide isomerase/thioredoxin
MCRRIALAALLACFVAAAQDIVRDVRATIAQNNFEAGEALIRNYQSGQGVTPEMIEAVSWLGRGALAAKQLDRADGYAMEARKLAQAQLSRRKLDAEPHLPLALGASIEVQAFVMAGRGERGEAVAFLRRELETWRDTSIVTRIQKNIHLLSLEGKPAPTLEVKQWLGPKPMPIAQLRGKPVILFFWAHWCGDCKRLIPDVARLVAEYRSKGLVLIGPTQHYGYVAGGAEAPPEQETEYMESIRRQFYAPLADMPAPVSEANFKNYGSSSSPTLVFIDRKGIVRLYHPGSMTYPELLAGVNAILRD